MLGEQHVKKENSVKLGLGGRGPVTTGAFSSP